MPKQRKNNNYILTLWRPLLPYGYIYKASRARPGYAVICNFWHSGTLKLRAEGQSARMSKITNGGLSRSGSECFIASCTHMATVGVKWLTARHSLFLQGFTFVQQIDRTISLSVWPTFRRWRRHLRCGTTPSVVSTRAGSRMELLSTWTVPVTRLRPDTSYFSFQATTSPISVSCKYFCEVSPPIVSNSTAEPLIRRVLTWTTFRSSTS